MTRYSRRPADVAAARHFLSTAVHRADADLPRYAELAASYGGIARSTGPVLNTMARECAELGQPDITVLVINATTGLPGSVGGKPVEPGEAGEQQWRDELQRVRRFDWTSH